ncbi:MAG: hypothetical protein RIR51_701 [Bacteroidota bacterium]|jgi:alkaline phosphatase
MRFVFLSLNLIFCYSLYSQNESLRKAHAHNDYLHEHPFYSAYNAGFGSIEVDVFFVEGKLLVAHDLAKVEFHRTIEDLYLKPLFSELKKNQNSNFHQLLVDFKNEPDSCLKLLIRQLEKEKDLLIKKEIKIVISGERPLPKDYVLYPNWIYFDGRKEENVPSIFSNRVPLESSSLFKFGVWSGNKPMPESMRKKVKEYIDFVHARGRKVRFWASPNTLIAYMTLNNLGVDYIGTDDIYGLRDYLENYDLRVNSEE